jgi:MFS family permease
VARTDVDVAAVFLRWTGLRAALHRGYVLTSSLYFVVDAGLSAWQLLLLGTVVAGTLLVADVPAGAFSDAYSRKWPLVIGHALLASGMLLTGLVTAFPLLALTQLLWGLGWAFSGGADVAWLTDELAQPGRRIDRVLAARARWDVAGGAFGVVAFGLLGAATSLAAATLVTGAGMALLGGFVAARFPEDRFTAERRLGTSLALIGRGARLARRDPEILLVLAATTVVNGAGVVAWLFPRQLVDLGFPSDPLLWYTALGLVASAVAVSALRLVEARIDRHQAAPVSYAAACVAGLVGLAVLALAPEAVAGSAGVLLVTGIAFPVTRAVSVIWVNRRTTSDVRATVHSFLSQAETAGEVVGGFALAALARATSIQVTLLACGASIAAAGAAVAALSRRTRRRSPRPAACRARPAG